MSAAPLHGLRVLDLTRLLPGGYATLLLADLGADVIKVEEPGRGDYMRWTPPMAGDLSAGHIALNRNKRSLTLNLKSPSAVELFLALVDDADVVVESFRPGVMDRLGIGWDQVSARNSSAIYCAITGYGQTGPRAGVAGHDANYIGYAGVLGITGEEGRRPVLPGVQIGDLAGGGMAAVIAILTALHRREVTGVGSFCDTAMMDGAMSWLSIHAGGFVAHGQEPERERMPLSGAFPCYRVYRAADGWLSVGALEPQFWTALCGALGRADLLDDAFAVGDRREEVIADLDAMFATRTRAEWLRTCEGLDVCLGPVNNFAEAFDDEQVQHRDMVVEHDVVGVGPWRHVGNPIKLSGHSEPLVRLPPPRLGEHSADILATVGVDATRFDQLRDDGVV